MFALLSRGHFPYARPARPKNRTASTNTHLGRALAGGSSSGSGDKGAPGPSSNSYGTSHPGDGRPASPDPAANRHDYDNRWEPWKAGGSGGSGGDGGRGGRSGFSFPGVRPGAAGSGGGSGGGGAGVGDDEGGAEQRRNALSQMLDEDPSERRLVMLILCQVKSNRAKSLQVKRCQDELAWVFVRAGCFRLLSAVSRFSNPPSRPGCPLFGTKNTQLSPTTG